MAQNQIQTVSAGGALQSPAAGSYAIQAGGRSAEGLVTELHGKYYAAGMAGQVFMSSTVIAGVVLPVAAATLSSKFTLWNPAGSGKVVELIAISMGLDSATTVVNSVGLMIQRSLSATSGVPTTLTSAYAAPLGIGGQAAAGAYTQATLTNVAIPGVSAATPVPIPFYPFGSFGATTDTAYQDMTHNFDGKILLGPDSLVAVCTTVTTTTASFVAIMWAEYPA